MNLQEAIALGAGMPVRDLRCQVKRAFDKRIAKTQYGEKTVFDAILADGATELRMTWWEPTLNPGDIQGQTVIISAVLNEKTGKLAGAGLRTGKDKDGNARLELSVNGDHLVIAGSDRAQPAAATPAAQPPAAPVAQPAATASVPSPVPVQAPTSPAPFVNGRLRESELYALAQRAASRFSEILLGNGLSKDPQTDAAIIGPMVSTVLIAATRNALELEPDLDAEPPPF